MRRAFASLVLVAALLAAGGHARADGGASCQNPTPRVNAARTALSAARDSLPARFELSDALVEASCYHDAVHTLEDGQALHPRSAELAAKLRNARSLISEQEYFEGKEQAELAAKLARNTLRCKKLADIDACDEALKLKADDVELLLAKGDALLKAARPGEADAVLRRARQVAPDDARVAPQLAATGAQRQPLLERCQKETDDGALQACRAALSKGGDDERQILARIATLHAPRELPARAVEPASGVAPAPPAAPAPTLVAAVRSYSNADEASRSH